MSAETEQLSALFLQRFKGLDRAHGEYTTNGEVSSKGKAKGSANTIRTGPDITLWSQHLDGSHRLGVVPIMDNGRCHFGAIDIDAYDLDLPAVEQRVAKLGLPLITCRSKSGGAHLYLFLSEPTDAALVRDKLALWASALGYPGVEIFPKQSRLAGKDDVGNWINMPYFDAELTTSYALDNGSAVSATRFMEMAKEREVSEGTLRDIELQGPSMPPGTPPCLLTLAANGVPEGTRNNALFAFGVLARLVEEDNPDTDAWRNLAASFNEQFMDPPLMPREVNAILKSISTKTYFYPCTTEPLASVCNKSACRKCAYGVGSDGPDDPGVLIDGVTKIMTDPPTWIFRIAGMNVELDTDDFLNQSRFKRRVVEKLNRVPQTLKQPKWEKLVNSLLQNAVEEAAPEDASTGGQFITHLYDFCNRQSRGNTFESLATNGLYHDEENKRFYFKSTAFKKYLEQQKFREYNDKQLWNALRKIDGVEHGGTNIKGRFVNHWSIPEANVTTGDYAVPRLPEEDF